MDKITQLKPKNLINQNPTEGMFAPWYTKKFGLGFPKYPFSGHCEPKFSSVEKEFRGNFSQGNEVGASVVVFSNKKCVVELYGGYADFESKLPYDKNTLQIVNSCSKFLESLGVACMVDRGKLNYNDKISSIWPEFGKNGRENVTVSDLMYHEAGLAFFDDTQPTLAETNNPDIRRERVVNQKYVLEKGQRVYHTVTRGLVANELVQRVDQTKRTLGQFYKDEINEPLDVEFYLGLESKLFSRKSRWYYHPRTKESKLFCDSPSFDVNIPNYNVETDKIKIYWKKSMKFFEQIKDPYNSREFLLNGFSSSNGVTNTMTLAKIGALLANNGELEDYRLISAAGIKDALSDLRTAFDPVLLMDTTVTRAGFGVFVFLDLPIETKFYGWAGVGSSIVLFNPDYQFSFCYLMNADTLVRINPEKEISLCINAFLAHLSQKT